MQDIIELIETGENVSPDTIFKCFQEIGEIGDIMIFKIDAGRDENQYTIVISSPDMSFESIRYDASTIEESLLKALKKYTSIKGAHCSIVAN